MVIVCAIFGTIAMGMMFDPAVVFESAESQTAYIAMVHTGHLRNLVNTTVSVTF